MIIFLWAACLRFLKVRNQLKGSHPPRWYNPPKGTRGALASSNELKRDGIKL